MISKPPDLGGISPFQKALAQETAKSSIPLVVGASYAGQVLAQLDDETVAVRIDNHTFSMQVGKEVLPGQTLNFKYLGIRPNHSFLLLAPAGDPPISGEKVLISETASLITQFIQATDAHAALPQIKEANSAGLPLTNKPNDPQLSAQDLKEAIVYSGLFYEAHLADFTEGKRSVDSILQEPQNKGVLDTSQVVSKQLDILENRALEWTGPIWPGQMMQWRIEADESGREGSFAEAEQLNQDLININSTLELDLPHLQKIIVKICIRKGALRVGLQAQHPHTQERFSNELAALSQSLMRGGHQLESIEVNAYE